MAHAWNACWVNALGGSNPPFSAVGPGPRTGAFLRSEPMPPSQAPAMRHAGAGSGDDAQPAEPPPGGLFAGANPAKGKAHDGERHPGAQSHRKGNRAQPGSP